ncbi:hypothetical protein [Mycobacterium sp. UM_Kg1]|uniref:hypothetical protein n=1 Tax=Mycobacterium sp. UM_Kg1 TaxID=1545691 RepID=UPI00061AF017|nr:hypothetical protein [Mycobacterium sp. UM_Kg1]
MDTQAQARTHMFARILGPFWAIVSLVALARTADMPMLLAGFEANGAWPWVTGAFILAAGLTVIALHQYWRSPAAVMVSLFGWIMVLRGAFLLAFPSAFMSMADSMIGATAVWRAVFLVFAATGLYLTYVGWVVPAEMAAGTAPRMRHLPHAS